MPAIESLADVMAENAFIQVASGDASLSIDVDVDAEEKPSREIRL